MRGEGSEGALLFLNYSVTRVEEEWSRICLLRELGWALLFHNLLKKLKISNSINLKLVKSN